MKFFSPQRGGGGRLFLPRRGVRSPGRNSCIGKMGTHVCPRYHIDLSAIEYSLGDALTALKHGNEACLHIWHLT